MRRLTAMTYIRLTPNSCRKTAVRPTVKECQNLTHAPQQAMCTGCQFAAVEAAATASRSWAFELQNRSAIEPLSYCANRRKETDGCKACEKWRTALEVAGVVSIDADVNCRTGCGSKRDRSKQVGGTGHCLLGVRAKHSSCFVLRAGRMEARIRGDDDPQVGPSLLCQC
jgi:hypothetical protein